MTVTLASFRQAFPEFTPEKYPDGTVTYNLGLSSRLLDAVRWGELYDDGILFLTAHNLALTAPAGAVGGIGGGAVGIGVPTGIVSSKSVGPISKSIDTSVGLQDGAGLYGATSYGRRYYQLLTMFGAGGIQL
ncbi:DUF4054 domain-containing protein [Methylobacterium sp. 1973]|uniref:DUF4054 domain-containing protein n=1 Tax=Methylobacterium sp. 1973 TaxID=3156421 RepID=UPI003397E6A9